MMSGFCRFKCEDFRGNFQLHQGMVGWRKGEDRKEMRLHQRQLCGYYPEEAREPLRVSSQKTIWSVY